MQIAAQAGHRVVGVFGQYAGDLTGVFYRAGAEPLSRCEVGLRIRAYFDLDEKRAPLVAVRRAEDPAAAAVRQAFPRPPPF